MTIVPTAYARSLLPLIDRALAEPGWLPAIPAPLQADYAVERLQQCRLFNRRLLILLTLVFDVYWVGEFVSAPEIVSLSGLLRFGLMTPAVILFVAWDRQGKIGRYYGGWLLLLTLVPALISALLCIRASSAAAMLDIRATPLILLGTSLAVRMPPREFLINMVAVPAMYVASLCFAHVVPAGEIGSLALIELSVTAAAIGFNLQLEWRDRRMFLLNTADRIMRGLLEAANRGLVRETLTDALTGVANRRCFDDTLAMFWHRGLAQRGAVGLIMADIDHFKRYNDYYGHQAGDDCLRRVAARIAALIREQDVLARYGGEEFAILLPDATPETVRGVAERVRAGVEALALAHAGLSPSGIITLSLGYGCISPHRGAIMRDLVAIADGELYAAKRGGRNMAMSARDDDGPVI
ncbi:MAG TPA: diguanylate cyclase [Acidocella sp.]|jgi:diguanylate cyclase (GGDEF)-like protein|nr:diguanylate cyclase [Acidocella sp.]